MSWKPGDKAIISDAFNGFCDEFGHSDSKVGEIVTIECEFEQFIYRDTYYQLIDKFFAVREDMLLPIQDDYDGLEVTTWDTVPWSPKELV
jgi:hypothetical protein